MNLEEAKIKSKITSDEEKSVKRYINFGHTQMNALASFDVLKYFEASSKGWYLLGVDSSTDEKKKTPEELGNEVLQSIEDFSNVYSAMCKYSKYASVPKYLYRGTSNTEARRLNSSESYDRLISTTTDSMVAKRFVEYQNAAYLRIRTDENIPFLDVDDFIGSENINREENEILLSPFSKIKKFNYADRDSEYTYYDLELSSPELYEFKEGEKDEFENIIRNSFSEIIEKGRQYKTLVDQDQINFYRFQRAHDSEDIEFLREKRDENYKQRQEIQPILDDFSAIVKKYIQGVCLEKQKEFEEAEKIVDDYNYKRIAEEREKIKEQEKRDKIDNYNGKVSNAKNNFSKISHQLDFSSNNLILKSEKYSEICSVLGIPFDSEIDINEIKASLTKAQNNIYIITNELDKKAIDENSEETVMENLAEDDVEKFLEVSEQVNNISNQMGKALGKYDSFAINDIKKGIDQKVQEIIRISRIEQLQKQKEVLENKKVSFFGKISGQEKLRRIQLENLDLQMEFERTRPLVQKKSYSIHDSLSDMMAFSNEELNGELTPAMEDLVSKVTMYFGINKKSIEEMASQKQEAKPAVVSENTTNVRTKILKLNQDNIFLNQGIQDNVYINNTEDNLKQYNVTTNMGINDFINDLNRISKITEFKDYFERNKSSNNEKHIKEDNDVVK